MDEIHLISNFESSVGLAFLSNSISQGLVASIVYNGGSFIGAYDAGRLIGAAMSFPTNRGGSLLLWLYGLGIHPEYLNMGVELSLKQTQRTWALEQGYKKIAWRLDPLHISDAYLDFHGLGATSSGYWGETDGKRVSDALEVVWNLSNGDVSAENMPHQGAKPGPLRDMQDDVFLLRFDSRGLPLLTLTLNQSVSRYCVEIPSDLSISEQTKLKDIWRAALYRVLQFAFSQGLSVCDFEKQEGRCWYVLRTPRPWFLYVVECRDGTLYTGITLDIVRRLTMHNRGRGASYTASRRPVRLVAAWHYRSQSDAQKSEIAFKRLSRRAKLGLIRDQLPYRGGSLVSGW